MTVCMSPVLISKCLSQNLGYNSKRYRVRVHSQAPPTLLIAFANATAGQINELSLGGGRAFHLKVR